MTSYSIRPLLCGRHSEVWKDGKQVGHLLAPLGDVLGSDWSLGLEKGGKVEVRWFPSREEALRHLGLSEATRNGIAA